MKALSVRQPWAWLIIAGHKDVENRSWTTTYRGPLLIHAARRPDDVMADIENRYGVSIDRTALQFWGIIGHVELVDVVKRSDSKWFLGPFGFVFRNPVALPFFPIGGRPKLFDLSALSSPAEWTPSLRWPQLMVGKFSIVPIFIIAAVHSLVAA
jgi:hypothetical protein